jgi:lipopolysaccharide biosynthesis glycosyltransferase
MNDSDLQDECLWLPILTVADYRVELGLCVSLHSALFNLRNGWGLDIRLLSGAVGRFGMNKLRRSLDATGKPYRLSIIPINDSSFKSFNAFANGSLFTYARFLFPDQFPDLSKCIYLDIDLLVLGDLAELFEIPLEGKAIGAVIDRGIVNAGHIWGILNHHDLGIPPETPYFNGGVLLLDLEEWRKSNLHKRCLAYAAKYPELCMFWDQTVMNTILAGDFLILPETWNQQFQTPDKTYKVTGILHYAGPAKPWNHQSKLPVDLQRLYDIAIDRTNWAGWRPPTHMPLGERLRRKLKRIQNGF